MDSYQPETETRSETPVISLKEENVKDECLSSREDSKQETAQEDDHDVKDKCPSEDACGQRAAQEEGVEDERLSSGDASKQEPQSDKKPETGEITDEQKDKLLHGLTIPEDGFLDLIGNGQLKKKVLKAGKPNSRPTDGQLLKTKVKISLEDGTCVHDAMEILVLGDNDFFTGVDMGVAFMDEGETALIVAAARFGFGSYGREPDVPPDATLNIEVELLEVLPPPDLTAMTADEILEHGERKRERGNNLFSRGEFSAAINAYSRAIRIFDAENRELKGEESVLHQIADSRLKCYNNMAASQLKIGASSAVIVSCKMVLERQPDNVKALYRMGKALCARGEMEKAIKSLKKAINLDPESKLLHRELSLWTQKQKRQMESERDMYKKMMGGMADAAVAQGKTSGSRTLKMSLIVGGIMAAMFSVGFAYYRTAH